MLSQLTIKNFGLIDEVFLELDAKLNCLTGETGAGKSIIIDALRIVLGERFSSSFIRNAQKPSSIEAVFESLSSELKSIEILKDYFEEDDSLIMQRTFHPDGRSKIKINGSTVPLSHLKQVGNLLIDFHGPHDHQMLLSADYHLGMLDALVDFKEDLVNYKKYFETYRETKRKLLELSSVAQTRNREIDMLQFQVKELEQVSLEEKDYQENLSNQAKVDNMEKLNECTAQIITLLSDDEGNVDERISKLFAPMNTLISSDESTKNMMETLIQFQELSGQLQSDIRNYAECLSFDSQQAQDINAQTDIYVDLLRKYGPTINDLKSFYEKARERFDLIENFKQNDIDLKKELADIELKLKKMATKITKKRKQTSLHLKKTIEKELSDLGIPHIKFECRVDPGDYQITGKDIVTFYISPNAGEELKPLSEIVSSGEAARVMLGLKKALIKVDPVPVLIFDEVDAQIGGRLGTVIGQKLREISNNRQVILITHLPQIASFADKHFKVLKFVDKGRTFTNVNSLEKDLRVTEIAQMMSGSDESSIAFDHAQKMLSEAAN